VRFGNGFVKLVRNVVYCNSKGHFYQKFSIAAEPQPKFISHKFREKRRLWVYGFEGGLVKFGAVWGWFGQL
jgi:hypothetical protein